MYSNSQQHKWGPFFLSSSCRNEKKARNTCIPRKVHVTTNHTILFDWFSTLQQRTRLFSLILASWTFPLNQIFIGKKCCIWDIFWIYIHLQMTESEFTLDYNKRNISWTNHILFLLKKLISIPVIFLLASCFYTCHFYSLKYSLRTKTSLFLGGERKKISFWQIISYSS